MCLSYWVIRSSSVAAELSWKYGAVYTSSDERLQWTCLFSSLLCDANWTVHGCSFSHRVLVPRTPMYDAARDERRATRSSGQDVGHYARAFRLGGSCCSFQ
jgi:hypothetical protein